MSAPLGAAAQIEVVDESRLVDALEGRGFVAPERFKALVGEITLQNGSVAARWFDYRGTSTDRDDWWPASSIKLYAAIAALEKSRSLGFSPRATLTYHYESTEEATYRARLAEIVRHAIVSSNNLAFDRLVELVGMDSINREFFTAENGLARTVFLRAYGGRNRHPDTGYAINRHSPPITIELGRRVREIPARDGTGAYDCPEQGNCTTLRELSGAMYRVMLHEHLPPDRRFDLDEPELSLLRRVLEAERREHGELLVDAIRTGFGPGATVRVFHKPGFAYRWTSDVMFIHRTDTDQRFIIAVAGWPGRRVLDEALTHIAAIIAASGLSSPRG
jgi:hypothetical protein